MTDEETGIPEGYIAWQILGYAEQLWNVDEASESDIVVYSKLYVEDSEKGRLIVSTMGCRRSEEEGAIEFWVLDDQNGLHAVYRADPESDDWNMVYPEA